MQVSLHLKLALLTGCVLSVACNLPAIAQGNWQVAAQQQILAPPLQQDIVPDAPSPQFQLAAVGDAADAPDRNAQTTVQTQTSPTGTTQQGNSSSQTTQQPSTQPQAPAAQKSQHDTAEEQIKQQETQRVLGVVPAFNTSYVQNAVRLSAGEKIRLAFRQSVDPFTFGAAFLLGGYHELDDNDAGFGWGAQGYFKRTGAAYLDSFDGEMIGNGILPAALHQDPRYFRLGYGSTMHRILYAAATTFICKGDSGKWQPNYSNVGGNIIAGAISNLYYPSQNSGWGETITNGFIVTFEGTAGGEFQEFWPDLSRRFLHRDPTHGLDAKARADNEARKKAKEQTRKKEEKKQN